MDKPVKTTKGQWTGAHFCASCDEELGDRRYFNDGICPYCGAKSSVITDTVIKTRRIVMKKYLVPVRLFGITWFHRPRYESDWEYKD